MATRPGNATRYRRSTGAVASCAAAALLLTGCLHDRPRHRMGSLPFPGLLTNYKAADPERLGRHQYVHIRFEHGDLGSENGGIVYTCRAGFLDLVHLRATVDWTWYSWKRLHEAIDQEVWSVHIAGPDLTWWRVQLHPPDGWEDWSRAERDAWTDEVSLRTAQRLGYLILTWHEIATWHGHRISLIIPEEESAFTYDDVMSHVVGIRVAERVIRAAPQDYELAVTEALDDELAELQVISRDSAREAAELIEGQWWNGRLARRHAGAGLEGGTVTPWLIPDLADCPNVSAEPFSLPWHADPLGHEGRIIVESILLQVGSVRHSIGLADDLPLEEKHFPAILEAIREQIRQDEDLRPPEHRAASVGDANNFDP